MENEWKYEFDIYEGLGIMHAQESFIVLALHRLQRFLANVKAEVFFQCMGHWDIRTSYIHVNNECSYLCKHQ